MTVSSALKIAGPAEAQALARIAAHAGEADLGARDLADDMALLVTSGLLGRLCGGATDPRAQVALLRRVGRASLPAGRLAEGHMNALKLITLYGTPDQHRHAMAAAAAGTIFGIWGADGDRAVRIAGQTPSGLRLAGKKRFASGLGTVGRAVVTAGTGGGTQLVLVTVDGGRRADLSAWNTTGMRATASGRYDFGGAMGEPLGQPGDYQREPHFHGGVWRYAAVQTGGLEVLAEEARMAVAQHGGDAAVPQLHRVARLAGLAHAARLMVEDAAVRVEAPGAGAIEVALALTAREAVEAACLEGIALADRALGTRSFTVGSTAERVRRDLAFFLRQADLDGKLQQAGQTLCQADLPVGEIWGRR